MTATQRGVESFFYKVEKSPVTPPTHPKQSMIVLLADAQCTRVQSVQNSASSVSKALVEVSSMVVATEKQEIYPTNDSDENMCHAGALCCKLGTSGTLKPGTKMTKNMLNLDYGEVSSVQNNPELLSIENYSTFSSQVSKKKCTRSLSVMI